MYYRYVERSGLAEVAAGDLDEAWRSRKPMLGAEVVPSRG